MSDHDGARDTTPQLFGVLGTLSPFDGYATRRRESARAGTCLSTRHLKA
jgi:hypothetical protein